MASYTLIPEKVVRFDKNTGYIDGVYTSQSQTMQANVRSNYLLAVFDMSQLPTYGEAVINMSTPAVPASMARIPSCDFWNADAYFYQSITSDLSLGSIINLDEVDYRKSSCFAGYRSEYNHWTHGFNDHLVSGLENKQFVRLSYNAFVNTSSTTAESTEDQNFTISNLRLTVETGSDIAFTASSNYQGGYQDPTKPLSVKVSSNFNNRGVRQYEVANGTLYYKKNTDSSYNSISFIGTEVTIPSGTFENGSDYDLYIVATADNGSTFTIPSVTLTTVDGTPSTVGIAPKNEITYGNITFQWSYSVPTDASQYAYDVQISSDNGSTWETVLNHIVSSDTTATYTQSAVGATLWRVRGYNQNDVAGAWSEPLYYLNNIPPEAPVITSVRGNGRQTVAWSADQQIAYEVKVFNSNGQEVFSTGEVYSTEKTALVNEYLENNNYTFMVRIAAGFGKWSDWATIQTSVSASLPAPQVTATTTAEGVTLSIVEDAAFDYFYILKNGVPVGKTTGTYTDLFVNGTVTYRVIGVASDDQYGYSYTTVTFKPAFDYFTTRTGTVVRCDLRWDRRVFTQKTTAPRLQTYDMLGERYPTHFINARARGQSYTIAAYDENNTFDSLIGDVVYFSTKDNGGAWCVVTGLSRSEELFGNDTTLDIEADSYSEAIEYDL
jgi:hypothetical protein